MAETKQEVNERVIGNSQQGLMPTQPNSGKIILRKPVQIGNGITTHVDELVERWIYVAAYGAGYSAGTASRALLVEALEAAQLELLQTNPSEYTHEVLDKIEAALQAAKQTC